MTLKSISFVVCVCFTITTIVWSAPEAFAITAQSLGSAFTRINTDMWRTSGASLGERALLAPDSELLRLWITNPEKLKSLYEQGVKDALDNGNLTREEAERLSRILKEIIDLRSDKDINNSGAITAARERLALLNSRLSELNIRIEKEQDVKSADGETQSASSLGDAGHRRREQNVRSGAEAGNEWEAGQSLGENGKKTPALRTRLREKADSGELFTYFFAEQIPEDCLQVPFVLTIGGKKYLVRSLSNFALTEFESQRAKWILSASGYLSYEEVRDALSEKPKDSEEKILPQTLFVYRLVKVDYPKEKWGRLKNFDIFPDASGRIVPRDYWRQMGINPTESDFYYHATTLGHLKTWAAIGRIGGLESVQRFLGLAIRHDLSFDIRSNWRSAYLDTLGKAHDLEDMFKLLMRISEKTAERFSAKVLYRRSVDLLKKRGINSELISETDFNERVIVRIPKKDINKRVKLKKKYFGQTMFGSANSLMVARWGLPVECLKNAEVITEKDISGVANKKEGEQVIYLGDRWKPFVSVIDVINEEPAGNKAIIWIIERLTLFFTLFTIGSVIYVGLSLLSIFSFMYFLAVQAAVFGTAYLFSKARERISEFRKKPVSETLKALPLVSRKEVNDESSGASLGVQEFADSDFRGPVILGGTGFVGSNLAELYAKQRKPVAVAFRSKKSGNFKNIEDVQRVLAKEGKEDNLVLVDAGRLVDPMKWTEELASLDDLKKVFSKGSVIYHLAAQPGARPRKDQSYRDFAVETFVVDVFFTKVIARLAKELNVPLIYGSSAHVFTLNPLFASPIEEPVTEDSEIPFHPQTEKFMATVNACFNEYVTSFLRGEASQNPVEFTTALLEDTLIESHPNPEIESLSLFRILEKLQELEEVKARKDLDTKAKRNAVDDFINTYPADLIFGIYSISKILAQGDVLALNPGTGFVLRYVNGYGPRMRPEVLHIFINRLLKKQSVGYSGHVRDFIAIEDSVEIMKRLAEKIGRGEMNANEIIHVASGRGPFSMKEALEQTAEVLGIDLDERSPSKLLDIPVLRLPRMSIEKLGLLLGISPQIALKEGLERLIKHMSSVEGTKNETQGASLGEDKEDKSEEPAAEQPDKERAPPGEAGGLRKETRLFNGIVWSVLAVTVGIPAMIWAMFQPTNLPHFLGVIAALATTSGIGGLIYSLVKPQTRAKLIQPKLLMPLVLLGMTLMRIVPIARYPWMDETHHTVNGIKLLTTGKWEIITSELPYTWAALSALTSMSIHLLIGPRILAVLFSVGTVYLVYKFSKEVFALIAKSDSFAKIKKWGPVTAAALFGVTNTAVYTGILAMHDVMGTFFLMLSMWLMHRGARAKSTKAMATMFLISHAALMVAMMSKFALISYAPFILAYSLTVICARNENFSKESVKTWALNYFASLVFVAGSVFGYFFHDIKTGIMNTRESVVLAAQYFVVPIYIVVGNVLLIAGPYLALAVSGLRQKLDNGLLKAVLFFGSMTLLYYHLGAGHVMGLKKHYTPILALVSPLMALGAFKLCGWIKDKYKTRNIMQGVSFVATAVVAVLFMGMAFTPLMSYWISQGVAGKWNSVSAIRSLHMNHPGLVVAAREHTSPYLAGVPVEQIMIFRPKNSWDVNRLRWERIAVVEVYPEDKEGIEILRKAGYEVIQDGVPTVLLNKELLRETSERTEKEPGNLLDLVHFEPGGGIKYSQKYGEPLILQQSSGWIWGWVPPLDLEERPIIEFLVRTDDSCAVWLELKDQNDRPIIGESRDGVRKARIEFPDTKGKWQKVTVDLRRDVCEEAKDTIARVIAFSNPMGNIEISNITFTGRSLGKKEPTAPLKREYKHLANDFPEFAKRTGDASLGTDEVRVIKVTAERDPHIIVMQRIVEFGMFLEENGIIVTLKHGGREAKATDFLAMLASEARTGAEFEFEVKSSRRLKSELIDRIFEVFSVILSDGEMKESLWSDVRGMVEREKSAEDGTAASSLGKTNGWTVYVLAGGVGSRLKTSIDNPKPLVDLCGKPLYSYTADKLEGLGFKMVVLTGYGAPALERNMKARYGNRNVEFERICELDGSKISGTGNSLWMLRERIKADPNEWILVCNSDDIYPNNEFLHAILANSSNGRGPVDAAVLAVMMQDPGQMGRVVRRRNGDFDQIVNKEVFEVEDTLTIAKGTPEEETVPMSTIVDVEKAEVNTNVLAFRKQPLLETLEKLQVRGEFLVSDIVDQMARDGRLVKVASLEEKNGFVSCNDAKGLKDAEKMISEGKSPISSRFPERSASDEEAEASSLGAENAQPGSFNFSLPIDKILKTKDPGLKSDWIDMFEYVVTFDKGSDEHARLAKLLSGVFRLDPTVTMIGKKAPKYVKNNFMFCVTRNGLPVLIHQYVEEKGENWFHAIAPKVEDKSAEIERLILQLKQLTVFNPHNDLFLIMPDTWDVDSLVRGVKHEGVTEMDFSFGRYTSSDAIRPDRIRPIDRSHRIQVSIPISGPVPENEELYEEAYRAESRINELIRENIESLARSDDLYPQGVYSFLASDYDDPDTEPEIVQHYADITAASQMRSTQRPGEDRMCWYIVAINFNHPYSLRSTLIMMERMRGLLVKEFPEFDLGHLNLAIERTRAKIEAEASSLGQVKAVVFDFMGTLMGEGEEELRSYLEELKKEGYKFGVLSTSKKPKVEEELAVIGLLDLMDVVVGGSDKIKKFPQLAEELGVRMEEIFYVDDSILFFRDYMSKEYPKLHRLAGIFECKKGPADILRNLKSEIEKVGAEASSLGSNERVAAIAGRQIRVLDGVLEEHQKNLEAKSLGKAEFAALLEAVEEAGLTNEGLIDRAKVFVAEFVVERLGVSAADMSKDINVVADGTDVIPNDQLLLAIKEISELGKLTVLYDGEKPLLAEQLKSKSSPLGPVVAYFEPKVITGRKVDAAEKIAKDAEHKNKGFGIISADENVLTELAGEINKVKYDSRQYEGMEFVTVAALLLTAHLAANPGIDANVLQRELKEIGISYNSDGGYFEVLADFAHAIIAKKAAAESLGRAA